MGNDNSKDGLKGMQDLTKTPSLRQRQPSPMATKTQKQTKFADIDVQSEEKQTKKVQYVRMKMLGFGTSGKVYECLDTTTSKTYAMKIIELASKTKEEAVKEVMSLKREIGLLKRLSHPNIVGYYHFEVNEEKRRVQIVLEKVTPGNLRDIVKEKPFTEVEASKMTKQIL